MLLSASELVHGGLTIRSISMTQVRLGGPEQHPVQQVLASGRLRAGPFLEDFEPRFARATGARFAVAVNSGTAALYLAYRASLELGDEVIVPDFTFAATASMVVAVGAKRVFADVDPITFPLDPADVARRTRGLAPVHLFGQPADISCLLGLAQRNRWRTIWAAACAIPRRRLLRLLPLEKHDHRRGRHAHHFPPHPRPRV